MTVPMKAQCFVTGFCRRLSASDSVITIITMLLNNNDGVLM